MSHILVKFTEKKEYAEEFLNGSLYMNTLEYFYKPQVSEDGKTIANATQRDPFEGTIANVSINKFSEIIKMWGKDNVFPFVSLAISGYGYCNVFCMARVGVEYIRRGNGYSLFDIRVPNMHGFGEHVVVIENEKEFLRRIDKAISRTYYKYVCGDVQYHDFLPGYEYLKNRPHIVVEYEPEIFISKFLKGKVIQRFDCFDKLEVNSWQQEWRLALYRGITNKEFCRLEIGDIRDIAHCTHRTKLDDDIDDVVRQNIRNVIDGYYGNIEREKLAELFYRLGEYKGRLLVGIGRSN